MKNRKQFLTAFGTAAAVLAIPTIARATTPANRPDYTVESYDIPGLGTVRRLQFASTPMRPPVTVTAAILDRRHAQATVVTDRLPKIVRGRPSAEVPGVTPEVTYNVASVGGLGGDIDRVVTGSVPPISIQTISAIDARAIASRLANAQSSIFAERYDAMTQLRDLAKLHDAPIAINGGYFDMVSFAPNGLLIVDGKTLSAPSSKYSGAMVIDAAGVPSLCRIEDVAHPAYAIQGGPFLIQLDGTVGQLDDPDWDRRTFVAQAGDAFVAATISDVSLRGLADLLVRFPDAFGVSRFDAALNLGGASTTGFFAQVDGTTIASQGAYLRSSDAILFGAKG